MPRPEDRKPAEAKEAERKALVMLDEHLEDWIEEKPSRHSYQEMKRAIREALRDSASRTQKPDIGLTCKRCHVNWVGGSIIDALMLGWHIVNQIVEYECPACAKESESASRTEKQFHSGDEVMKHYVKDYHPTCPHCGRNTDEDSRTEGEKNSGEGELCSASVASSAAVPSSPTSPDRDEVEEFFHGKSEEAILARHLGQTLDHAMPADKLLRAAKNALRWFRSRPVKIVEKKQEPPHA